MAGVYEMWHIRAKKVRKETEERIIKLLDEDFVYDEPVVIERDRLIALIKGENK